MAFIGVRLRKGGRHRDMGPSRIAGATGSCEPGDGCRSAFSVVVAVRVEVSVGGDDVAGEGDGGVGCKGRVVVDVAAFGGTGHDVERAAGGDGGVVEDMGFGVGGAGEDLIEFGVPEEGDEWGGWGDGGGMFGLEGCRVENV